MVVPSRFGSGDMLPTETNLMTGPNSFGHAGRGGLLAFAGYAHEQSIAFGYVMNHIIEDPGDVRAASLVDAVRRSLASLGEADPRRAVSPDLRGGQGPAAGPQLRQATAFLVMDLGTSTCPMARSIVISMTTRSGSGAGVRPYRLP